MMKWALPVKFNLLILKTILAIEIYLKNGTLARILLNY
jgi:hypothetical protein